MMKPYANAGREWRVIIPVGAFSGEEHYCIRLALAKRFGGYTRFEAIGGWMSEQTPGPEEEAVYVYDIAAAPSQGDSICDFAGWVRDRGKQEAVHVRDPDMRTIQVDGYRDWICMPWLDNLDLIIMKIKKSGRE